MLSHIHILIGVKSILSPLLSPVTHSLDMTRWRRQQNWELDWHKARKRERKAETEFARRLRKWRQKRQVKRVSERERKREVKWELFARSGARVAHLNELRCNWIFLLSPYLCDIIRTVKTVYLHADLVAIRLFMIIVFVCGPEGDVRGFGADRKSISKLPRAC